MSVNCIVNYLNKNFAQVLASAANGKCRFLSRTDDLAVDANGFPSEAFSARTSSFFPCSWRTVTPKEAKIAEQTRSTVIYEIVLAQTALDGSAVTALPSDRAELQISSTVTQTLDIIGRFNESGIAWKILAIDRDDNS